MRFITSKISFCLSPVFKLLTSKLAGLKTAGHCLDPLNDEGVFGLYQKIAEKVVGHPKLPCEFTHLDSISFHYDGKENSDQEASAAIHITKGYSCDHRPQLNQLVLNLICENLSGIPVYMQAQSDNINDVERFKKIVKSHFNSLKAALQCHYSVAYAALYVKETIVELNALGQSFIKRLYGICYYYGLCYCLADIPQHFMNIFADN